MLQKIGTSCFYRSGLEEFVAPQRLREIEGKAFNSCYKLRRVTLNEGLEVLKDEYNEEWKQYSGVFPYCKIEEITLPSTLKEIGQCTFKDCRCLRTIYVKSGCKADLSQLDMPSSAQIVWV